MIKLSTSNLLRESSQKINTRCLENCSTEAHFLTLHTLGNDSHIPYHVSYNSKNTALPVTSQKMKPFWATILSSLFPLHCNCNTILFCRFISVDKQVIVFMVFISLIFYFPAERQFDQKNFIKKVILYIKSLKKKQNFSRCA